jgi:tetratricopeptide (TPR) repeat protein/outer membrane protein OmpA-like peptidoglycan-associated protein
LACTKKVFIFNRVIKHPFIPRFFLLLMTCLWAFAASAQSAKSFYKAARQSEKSFNYQAAVDNYSKALELKKDNYKYLLGRAGNYMLLNQKDKALKDYEDAFRVKNSDKKLYLQITEVAIDLGDWKKGKQYADLLIMKSPKNTEAYRRSAWCSLMLKQFQTTVDLCNTALGKEQYNHTTHYYKALALDSMKRYSEANADYIIAIKLLYNYELDDNKKVLPKYKAYFYNHAGCLHSMTDYPNAIKDYTTAVELDNSDAFEPKNYMVFYKRSISYLATQDYLNPIGDLNKALVLNNEFKEGFFQRGEVYKKTSQFQSAISDYTKVILLDEKNALAYKRRAQCYQELASWPEAIADYTRVVKMNPSDAEAKQQLDMVTKKLYEANRENDDPDVKITFPFIDGSGFANVFASQISTVVEGSVKDKSLIASITVNGVDARYKNEEKNPDFTCIVPVGDKRMLEIVVKDIYNNSTTKTIKVGRINEETSVVVRFAGQILSDDGRKTAVSGKKINLVNERGEVFYSTFTDNTGKFVFEKLPYDKNYLLAFDVEDNTLLSGINSFVVVNEKGVEILKSAKGSKGTFTFEVLKNDPVTMSLMTIDDSPMMIDMKGKIMAGEGNKEPLSNITILLVNEKGEIVATKKTDASGLFIFKNLLPAQSYMIKIDEEDSKNINYNRIIIADDQNHVIREISKDQFGKFAYRLLPTESIQLTEVSEEIADPWIGAIKLDNKKKEISIIENIYYASGSFVIPKDAEVILDKAYTALTENPKIILEVQSHTDALAGDDFNMELSQKRANAVVEYLVKKGINKKRMIASGLGETQLANRCVNGVDCSDEEHKQNRRTVFKLSYEGSK